MNAGLDLHNGIGGHHRRSWHRWLIAMCASEKNNTSSSSALRALVLYFSSIRRLRRLPIAPCSPAQGESLKDLSNVHTTRYTEGVEHHFHGRSVG